MDNPDKLPAQGLKNRLLRVKRAFLYSCQGFKHAWLREAAFREEIYLALPCCLIIAFLTVSRVEKAMLLASILILLIVELINSSLETCIDLISPNHHPLAGIAKDIASSAVFLALMLVVLTWLIILL